MDTLNALLTALGDLLLFPFQSHPTAGLVVWSAITGMVMAYVFGKTSNQRALRRTADNIRAQLLGVKLFKDDLVVTWRCQVALLKATGMRLLLSVPPMLVMLIPVVWIMTQLAMRYEYRPLVAGERSVVSLQVKPEHWREVCGVQLQSGEGYELETEGLRDERNTTIYWRVRATGGQSRPLSWSIDGTTVSKMLPMATTRDTLVTASPVRPAPLLWDRLVYPAETPLAADLPVESIGVQLTPRVTPVLGWHIPWWATFFLVSLVAAFVTGRILGVQY